MFIKAIPDKPRVRFNLPQYEPSAPAPMPWALEMKGVSNAEPSQLVRMLSGAILGCGGWILSRSASDSGRVSILFEFERQSCLDIYSVVVAAGVELSQNGHIRMTELCHCTRNHLENCAMEIASIDLEIHTLPRRNANSRTPGDDPQGEAG